MSQPEFLLRGEQSDWFRVEVVGESYCKEYLATLIDSRNDAYKPYTARLRRDPTNKHDKNAIEVWIGNGRAGFLPREQAAVYQKPLQIVEGWGYQPAARAQVHWYRQEYEPVIGVRLDLVAPGRLLPMNWPDPQQPHVVMPRFSRPYQLSGEEAALDVLVPLISRAYEPGLAMAFVTLHEVPPRKGTAGMRVEARVDGQVIGRLSKQTGDQIFPLLRQVWDAGKVAYAEAEFEGNQFGVEVEIYVKPASRLSEPEVQSFTAALRR